MSRLRAAIRDRWYYRLGGNLWSYWQSYISFFREVCDLELPGDLWDRARAYETTAKSAGWWWPHEQFVMVCERPTEIHLEQVGPAGWGSHRLHCETGPAISWRDGWALYYWHGREVPAWVINDPTPERIADEANVEIRRCAIEHLGWDRYIQAAGLNPISTDAFGELFSIDGDRETRVVLVTNGSAERDGTVRRYGIPVPADCRTPLAAVAWTYGLKPKQYEALQRRT